MNYEVIVVSLLETNCYVVYCQDSLECAVVDPGAEADRIFQLIAIKSLKPALILNTHGHIDHIGANKDIKEKFNIPLYIHSADSAMLGNVQQSEMAAFLGVVESPSPDHLLNDGD
ncbi:MBL fold metallo-hydrolase, partial [bacterium]|nr:MBL fold metallo-hydrolase [bacterium]